jgi:hypothetical protein
MQGPTSSRCVSRAANPRCVIMETIAVLWKRGNGVVAERKPASATSPEGFRATSPSNCSAMNRCRPRLLADPHCPHPPHDIHLRLLTSTALRLFFSSKRILNERGGVSCKAIVELVHAHQQGHDCCAAKTLVCRVVLARHSVDCYLPI